MKVTFLFNKGDNNIMLIKNWLTKLKLDQYLVNFVRAGYYSMELLTLQMISK